MLAQNVNTEIMQIAEDMKEVIRHINEWNKTVDKTDPVSYLTN